jgi:hypothetical protein
MGGPALFSDGIWRLFRPDYPTGAEKCRCLVLLNGRGALPTLLAMLLVQSRVQGEGEAKLPSFLTYRLISVIPATNREDKTVTETQPSRLKNQKIPSDTVPSDPTPHCSGVRHIRTSGNGPGGNIRSCIKSVSEMSHLEQVFGIFGSQAPISLSNPEKYPGSRICIGCH